ncbi:hypothetical protein JXA40_04835 [bacterium]|nr:hypothetical protein [candidate division CSSED10-310 bacterium]
MAIVTALQFSTSSGAMLCDEEYWFLRRRRSFFLDNIRNILPREISEALGIEAAYGGYGHPGFHEEVIRRTRDNILKIFKSGDKVRNMPVNDLEAIAEIIRQTMQDIRQRKVNDMLKFLYGFTMDDLNRGFFEEDGTRYDLAQEAIKTEARKIITYEKKGNLTDPIFKNKAVLIGYDPQSKFRAFHINAENTVYSLISGGFEAIGAGLYGAGIEFSRIMNNLTLDQRRTGFDPVWGMLALYQATLKGYDHFHEVGGGLSLIYIDGNGQDHANRYFEFSGDTTRLAMEMVRALQHGLITQEKIYPLLEKLFFKQADRTDVEHLFFDQIEDQATLHKLLRGYKLPPFPELPPGSPVKPQKPGKGGAKR